MRLHQLVRFFVFVLQPIADVQLVAGGRLDRPRRRLLHVVNLRLLLPADAHGQLDLEFQRADLEVIAVFQFAFALQPLVVDERPVLTAEIANPRPPLVEEKSRNGGG